MIFWAQPAMLFIVLIHSKVASVNMLHNMEELGWGNSDIMPCGNVILYGRMTLLFIFLAISFLIVIGFSLGLLRLFKEFLY